MPGRAATGAGGSRERAAGRASPGRGGAGPGRVRRLHPGSCRPPAGPGFLSPASPWPPARRAGPAQPREGRGLRALPAAAPAGAERSGAGAQPGPAQPSRAFAGPAKLPGGLRDIDIYFFSLIYFKFFGTLGGDPGAEPPSPSLRRPGGARARSAAGPRGWAPAERPPLSPARRGQRGRAAWPRSSAPRRSR